MRTSNCPASTRWLSVNQNLRDESGNVGRDRRDVSAHIGVVGALEEAACCPPVIAVTGDGQESQAGEDQQCDLLKRQSPLRLGGDWCAPFCQCIHDGPLKEYMHLFVRASPHARK